MLQLLYSELLLFQGFFVYSVEIKICPSSLLLLFLQIEKFKTIEKLFQKCYEGLGMMVFLSFLFLCLIGLFSFNTKLLLFLTILCKKEEWWCYFQINNYCIFFFIFCHNIVVFFFVLLSFSQNVVFFVSGEIFF